MILALTLGQIGCGLLLCSWLAPRDEVGDEFLRMMALLAAAFLLPLAAVGAPPTAWLLVPAAVLSGIAGVLFPRGRAPLSLVLLGLATILAILGIVVPVLPFGRSAAGAGAETWLLAFHSLTSAALLGATIGGMLLGHWYLVNTGMPIAPLRRMAVAMGAAALIKVPMLLAVFGMYGWPPTRLGWAMALFLPPGLFYFIRVLIGILGPLSLAPMVWQTARLQATQSATGILYAAVVLVLIGEMTANFLMARTPFPF